MFRTTIAVAVLSITVGAAFAEPAQPTMTLKPLRQIVATPSPALAGIKVFTAGPKQNVQATPDVMPPRITMGISKGAGAKFQQVMSATKGASGPVTITTQQPYWNEVGFITTATHGGRIFTDALGNYIEWYGSDDPNKSAYVIEHFLAEPGHTYLIDTNVSVSGAGNCKIILRAPSQDELKTPCAGNGEQQHILTAYKEDNYKAWQWFRIAASEGAIITFWSFTVTRLD